MGHSRRLSCSLPFACIASFVLVVAGCGRRPTAVSLEFLADFNAPSGIVFAQLGDPAAEPSARAIGAQSTLEFNQQRKLAGDFGGISALVYDDRTGLLYVLSDSSNLRIFVIAPKLTEKSLQLEPEAILRLVDASGAPIPVFTLDPEGLAMTSDGDFFVASEGYAGRDPRVDPGIFHFSHAGRLIGNLPLPSYYAPHGDTGVRANAGLESLSLSPDGASLLTATERNLAQDGDCSADSGCLVRMLRYLRDAGGWVPVTEYFYRTDPSVVSSLGLSEVVWLEGDILLTLERGYERFDDGSTRQTVRIYQLRLPQYLSESERNTPLEKSLVLDLDSVKDRFSEGFQRLDNYEGMCLGPPLPNGDRTLLVVSDDNYSSEQRISLLAFRITVN